MQLTDLITGADGRLSHTKLWANVGLAAITVKFLMVQTSVDLMLAYGALASGHYLAKRWLASKEKANGET